jgi:hypothetical protein
MRTLRVSIVVCGLLATRIAAAQGDPKAEDAKPASEDAPVQMDNVATGQPAPQASPPPPSLDPPPPAGRPGSGGAPTSSGGTGGGAAGSSDWKFDFHGYFRAPMRLGLGHRDKPLEGQSSSTVHNPVVPDDQYLGWQYTGVQSKDWAELFLSYGNSWVKGTVGLLGFNFSDASWAQANAQFGIGQGWVTLTPKTGYQNVRFEAKVGSFWSKYGTAGKYDAGKYDTFLFGRTHTMGETARMEIDIGKVTLWGEEGFGVKQPDPNKYNNAKLTLLAHGHAGVRWNNTLELGVHVLHSWANEEDRENSVLLGLPDGKLTVSGADIRVTNTPAGDLYFGFSHIGASNATTVSEAIEVLHSGGGGEFDLGVKGNYLDGPTASSKGNGSVNTLLLQYDFSLANLLANLKTPKTSYWGDGPDLAASFFLMYNAVSSDDKDMDGVKKIKYGVDLLGTPLKWLGLGVRIDRVQPNSRVSEQSFGILSPRLVFRTAFLTHEEVTLQYSRYMYNQRECSAKAGADPTLCVQPPSAPSLPTGFGSAQPANPTDVRGAATTRPDLNVIKLQASMWW